MPQAIERLFATPRTTPRMPRMTPAVAPTERVCSIKASLVLDGDCCAVPASGLASLDTHGKERLSSIVTKCVSLLYMRLEPGRLRARIINRR